MILCDLFHALVEVLELVMQLHRHGHDHTKPSCRSRQAIW